MPPATPAKIVDVSAALTALEPLGANQYCIAFGPGTTQFCATPNGYSATELPRKVIKDLLRGQIKKVLHASFGSAANLFFFTYEMRDGSIAHRAGTDLPHRLESFVARASSLSQKWASSLRVQLGANESYVAWTGSVWVAHGIPTGLLTALHNASSFDYNDANGSALKSGTIDNIAWHDNDSWYLKNGGAHTSSLLDRGAEVLRYAWKDMLHASLSYTNLAVRAQLLFQSTGTEVSRYVAINPHSPRGGTFVFFKKAQDGCEPDFILRFEPEVVVSRLLRKRDLASDTVLRDPPGSSQVINVPKNSERLQVFQAAVSKRTGRSHVKDSWELELKKGERVKILKYMGNDWFFVEDRRKQNGWVHGAWLDFQQMIPHVDPREAYARFTVDVEKMLKAGNIRTFPVLSRYMNACAKEVCSPLKKDTHCLGICIHDLHELMHGSGDYCLDTLKLERNKWHPDRFARYCHPEHREFLREKAQVLFVLFGVLMDMLENPPAPEPDA